MDQIIIAITGGIAIFLTQDSRESFRKWACIVGIFGQYFWLTSTYAAGQWGMFALTIFYVVAWSKGIWTHWIKRN